MSFWNLERAIRTCPNVSRPSKGVVRAVQQLRCISTDDEIASSVLTEATVEIATAISVCLPIGTLKVVIQTCIEHPSDLREGVITAIAAHAIPRLDIEDLVVLATDAEIVDRKLNAPILGATVKVLRGKGAKKLKSGLTSEEAANEIVKEISAGPWDADFAKAVISSDGFLSSASGNEMISKLVNSIFELEDTDLAVKVVVNPALTMRVRWVFVQHLIEKYSSADRAVELLSFVAKSRAVIVRQLRAFRAVSGIHVLEALVGLDDSMVMKTCAETVVRMARSLHSIALKRTIHWYAIFPNRDAHFKKWLGTNLSRQLGKMEAPRVRNFLSTVAVKADGHLVLDPIIKSGEISCPLMFDALAQALMRPGLPTATVERIAPRLVDCCDCNSTEKWDSLVLVLPAETLPCLALCTVLRFPHQPQRASVVIERMRKILEGPGGENHRGPYTTAVARLSALGYSCDGWRDLVCPENPLAQVVGLSSKVTLARAQGGHRCEGLEGPLVTELNLQVDKEVAGQEWLGEFPPVLPCGDLHDAECNLVELMEVYSPHRLWFARRCLVAASMVASRELTSAPLVSFITRKSPTGEAHEICVRHDVGYVAAVVDLLATSFESGEKNEALWWSIFARLFDCSTTSERTLKILTEILDKMLPLESTQCAFRTLEKLALESFMDTESCRRSRWVAQSLHTIYHVAMRCGKNENSSWLEDRRLFIVHLIRTVSLDLCPDALLLVFECAMMFGASCQHLRCIAEAAVEGCEDADRQTMRYPPLLGPSLKRCRRVVSKRVIQWLCDLAEQTKEEIVENDTDGGVGSLVDRVAKATYQILIQGSFLKSCLSSADDGLLLAVMKPLHRFIDHLVSLMKQEDTRAPRLLRTARCLHDKIDKLLLVDTTSRMDASRLARDVISLRFSLRALANITRDSKHTSGAMEVRNGEVDSTLSAASPCPSPSSSSTYRRGFGIHPHPSATKRRRFSYLPTPCTARR